MCQLCGGIEPYVVASAAAAGSCGCYLLSRLINKFRGRDELDGEEEDSQEGQEEQKVAEVRE